MSIFEAILTNGNSISEGFKNLKGKHDYLIAFDGEIVVCFFYDTKPGKSLLEKYLKDNNCNVNVDIRKMTLKKDNEFFELNLGKKIVILDKKVVLYEDVIHKAETTKINGYNPLKLKHGINIFTS